MKARDIMVMNVITVGPEASVRQVADILFKNRISALPVVDEHGELIGIVSEGDLARRAELETDYRRSWWLETFARKSKETLAVEYVKSHARRVEDVMTRRVITATPGTVWAGLSTDGRYLTIHVLDLQDEETWIRTIKDRYERRLMEIFE